ncbi:MAG: sodium-dependent transporter [Spirochaetaceae bacterium]|nr:sodium-dependent transporter [Spirochaetaceae bacterium]
MQQRETLSSRLGFILLSAGCAIGLGNVWRFPFITGKYGGATFVLIYLAFLAIFGLPIMVMEFAIGRASRKTMGEAYRELEPKGSYWHLIGPVSIANSYILMMYYTTITGWLLSYFWQYLTGKMANLTGAAVTAHFSEMLAHPLSMALWMALSIILGFLIGSGGLQKGVETVTKKMMAGLLVLIVVLAVHSLLLPGGKEGLAFYLKPSLSHIQEAGLFDVVFAAMSTVITVLENITSYWIDHRGMRRGRVCLVNAILLVLLSLPCVLGFNVLSGFHPLGAGSGVLDLEDFIVSSTLLPLGSLLLCMFCTRRIGWGWKAFIEEADAGEGLQFPKWARAWVTWGIPILFIIVFIKGYIDILVH